MNRTITTTSITRRRPCLRHAALALCAVLVALVAASCTADALDGTDPGAPSGNGNPDDVLTFAVGPRPGFTEVAATRGTDTKAVIPSNSAVIPGLTRDLPPRRAGLSLQEIAGQARNDKKSARNDSGSTPATRAELTDNGTRWQTGDVLWLDVRFYRDKQAGIAGAIATIRYTSALKYDGAEWRYLTEAEAQDLNTGNIPGFTRRMRWPRESKEWVAPGMDITAYYAGSGKPDADRTITINPTGEIPVTPLIVGSTAMCSPDVQPVPLEFGYNCSRVRIPAGYKVELTYPQYWSTIDFSLDKGIGINPELITEIPARSETTDVLLLFLNYPGNNPTAKLTRDNVSYTFTFPEVTNADGNLTRDGASYTLTPYTSGTQTPVADYDLTVATETELRDLAQAVNAGEKLPNGKPFAEARVLQTANIELTQGEWVPIGNRYDNPFRGAYNGNGNEISGLSITTAPQLDNTQTGVPTSYAGLFGCAEGAVLTGIRLREVKINIPQGGGGNNLCVGSIAGNISNSTLSLCSADGTVNAGNKQEVDAGGIVGTSWYSTISRCRADVETKAVATDARGTAIAGGIAGLNAPCSFILSCETQGRPVTAKGSEQAWAGGITGFNMDATLIAFCRTGANVVTAWNSNENYAGGLVGNNWGSIYSCYSRATAEALDGTGVQYAGAIVGYCEPLGNVSHCYGAGTTGQGTSNLDEGGNIFYNTDPDAGKIFGVMTGYGGKVESIDNGIGGTYYPFTTSYAPSATPAYGIIPQRAVWKSDGAWNIGDGTYPGLNIEEYEGKE